MLASFASVAPHLEFKLAARVRPDLFARPLPLRHTKHVCRVPVHGDIEWTHAPPSAPNADCITFKERSGKGFEREAILGAHFLRLRFSRHDCGSLSLTGSSSRDS